jgi:hypothetical protein
MQVRPDQAWEAFARLADLEQFGGRRIKEVRHQPLTPGGRARLTLFEQVGEAGRPHPRMRITLPPAVDPAADEPLLADTAEPPSDAASFDGWLAGALEAAAVALTAETPPAGDQGSPRYRKNSVRVQRLARFFAAVGGRLRGWLSDGTLNPDAADGCWLALRRREAVAYAGRLAFDDEDTGTYHSYEHDAPFVHYLEQILATLPPEGSEAFALLDDEQRGAVVRQRAQARNHLDHLMRHKYAHDGIVETDIERSLGGILIDRETRHVVSETPASRGGLSPAYELLRVDPAADHADAGRWLYRDSRGGLRRETDGGDVEVAESRLQRTALAPERLSFRRAPGDPRLRDGVRLDWDRDGSLRDEPIGWVSWAGHCDIKAVMESLGITLLDAPSVVEYRADTGATHTYDRALLVEMVASAMELGSTYRRVDGGGRIQRGIHRFGGARNDSRPDRLQFQGHGQGKSFRWPLGGRKDAFCVAAIERDGESLDVGRVFSRQLPDDETLDFAPNPAYLKTVEQDYNLIDVSGCVVRARVQEEIFDPTSGYPTRRSTETVVDLRAEPAETRCYLGTSMKDPARREVYRVYLDREGGGIEALLDRYDKGEDGAYRPIEQPDETVTLPLVAPLSVTLSHEMKHDDPAMFQSLLEVALRQAQNICADTDMRAEVWNGVVTRLNSERIAVDRETRVEHWRVQIKARFGSATLEYLVRRTPAGEPEAFCPVPGEQTPGAAPDFLWQDIPDVASKGVESPGGQADAPRVWVVNDTMADREIVSLSAEPEIPGGVYVYDDHIKNLFELLFCGLGGFGHTLVHGNKRYGYTDEEAWLADVARCDTLRSAMAFEAD